MWPGEGEGVSWVGEAPAGDAVRKGLLSEGSSESEWSELEWSGSEGEEVKEEGVEVKEEDAYTQTNKPFTQPNAITKTTAIKKGGNAAEQWAPSTRPRSPPAHNPGPPRLHPASTPRPNQDDEIMRHLVGGMAGLAILMSQDGSGRWRIHKRR